MSRRVLTSSTQPEIWSIHVVGRTRTAKKYTKMKNARARRAELLFLLIRAIVLWRSRRHHRRLPNLLNESSGLNRSLRMKESAS